MKNETKLKPNYSLWISCVMAIIVNTVIVIVLEKDIIDDRTFRFIIAIMMTWAAFNQVIFLIRTRNRRFTFPLLLFMDIALAHYADWFKFYELRTVFGILFIPLLITVLIMEIQKKFTFKARNILELAAKPIRGTSNGFTQRPYPAGKHKFTKEDIIGFARYINKHLITLSFIDEDKVILEITANRWKYLFSLKANLQKTTFVSFDFSGNISVHIAEKEYKKYKDELTFNELCASLGNVFKRFLGYYKSGSREKILDEIVSINSEKNEDNQ